MMYYVRQNNRFQMNAKELFNRLYYKAEKKNPITSKQLLIVLYYGFSFSLLLNSSFEQ